MPFCTYLFSVNAGDYKSISKETSKKLPMTFYCRSQLYDSMIQSIDFFFEVTEKCLDVLEKFFGTEYPFSKYD